MRPGFAIGIVFLLGGCKGEPAKMAAFQFTIEEIFYIKPPLDRVILVGTIEEGQVRVGESLTVQCRNGPVSAIVEGIEAFQKGEIQQANKGQQVGLRMKGLTKDQPAKGDRITR
jgi:translation elongation factor EF-Tu-like GTPase